MCGEPSQLRVCFFANASREGDVGSVEGDGLPKESIGGEMGQRIWRRPSREKKTKERRRKKDKEDERRRKKDEEEKKGVGNKRQGKKRKPVGQEHDTFHDAGAGAVDPMGTMPGIAPLTSRE